ncbi:MAG: flagellar biosynthetic protein FliP [Halobacteriovoraceae bacterium]|nr:flagellar biosynthetic protein FliP [Halobacteriovoraceae bacterium]|tara:strand:+ start:3911 stop:4639 length:729 start_codon:yes stop_codon:yes gene_type:complete
MTTFLGVLSTGAFAQAAGSGVNLPGLSVNFGQGTNLVDTMQVMVLFTVLTLAPAIIILCTSFTRIIVVLAFVRQAIGTQSMPPNQLLIGFAMFLSVFVMMPTGKNIYDKAVDPLMNKAITTTQALETIEVELRGFMSKQVRKADIGLFYDVTGTTAPNDINAVPIHFLIPAFIISELKTAFQIGFLLYIPFLVLDMVVASVLMAMGMMMLPPVIISMPFKLLLFVLVDGWQLVTGSILRSFN